MIKNMLRKYFNKLFIYVLCFIIFYLIKENGNNISNIKYLNNQSIEYSRKINFLLDNNTNLETKIKCLGSLYNQSCLFENLYYINSTFMILIVKNTYLPNYLVRTNPFDFNPKKPLKQIFNRYIDLENFVNYIIKPTRIESVTIYFNAYWYNNIGHGLFDGLYPGYLSLIRFSPRHLYPFRILTNIDNCQKCLIEDIYQRFSGLEILKENYLNKISNNKWFVFDEIIMGSGYLCQRCIQSNFQLPGGIQLNGSKLFRDRMYQQYSILPPIKRIKYSSEYRRTSKPLLAYIIHNKRFTNKDKEQIDQAINQINIYTNNILLNNKNNLLEKLKYPLIHVFYIDYEQMKSIKYLNRTENKFMSQLKILREIDIHISGPGTGQMYQTFLPDGSIHINLGGIKYSDSNQIYTSYLEQYITSGTPYIKGIYYPIHQRIKGIEKNQIIQLIYQAGQLIFQGFPLPVNPYDNLALDGKLFLEMCEKDKEFCSLVTNRSSNKSLNCLDFWVEDFIHEQYQWKLEGFIQNEKNITCYFNHTLLNQLKQKYFIKYDQNYSLKNFFQQIYKHLFLY